MTAPTAQNLRSDLPLVRFRPPRFGLAAAPIGRLADPGADHLALATVDAAYGAGIRFFDTAPQYAGRSEQRLGTALARRPRGEYLVATKVGRLLTRSGARPDFSAAGIERSLAGSLERLGIDTIDLAFIHDAYEDPDEHWRQAIDEAYPALHTLREQGVVRAVGVAMDQWQLLDRFVRDTDVDAVLLNGGYTLIDQSAGPLLDRCRTRGVAAVVGSVLPEPVRPSGQPGKPPDVPANLRQIAAVCERSGVTLPQVALAFPAQHPAVTSVLVDAASPAEIRAQAALVRRPIPVGVWHELAAGNLVDTHR